ncbi:MAG: flagellar biosynthesis protein FlhB [Gammaproteobacteria bacterium]|nr:MAG: flagellar biosynthesis protein FlhB [Gammaproteobacteria bacterium]
MAEENQGQEKTEQPTPRRQQEAREEGQIARSRELTTMLMLMTAGLSFLILGPAMTGGLARLMQHFFSLHGLAQGGPGLVHEALAQALVEALRAIAPLLAVMFVVALAAPMALGGWGLSGKALAFKWERIDPVKGLGRVFSARGLVELLKALAKFILICLFLSLFLWHYRHGLLEVGNGSLEGGMAQGGRLILRGFLLVASATVIIALVDVPFQLWDHGRKLRMTRQEVKEELKQTEGRPEVRGRIRQLQQEVARRRMMAEVPKADVVVTNPSHYAVALRYNQQRMRAPRVVARGVDEVALRIREVASRHGVVVVQAPVLARAIYHSTRLEQEIPEGLYLAVAQVLAYVFQLRSHDGRGPEPVLPTEFPIPDELRREAGS